MAPDPMHPYVDLEVGTLDLDPFLADLQMER
jgi:hypothetical protein